MSADVHLARRPTPDTPSPPDGDGRAPWLLGPALIVVALAVLVVVGAWAVILTQPTTTLPGLGVTWQRSVDFGRDLLGVDSVGTPAYADRAAWGEVLPLAVDTVVMSVLAVGLAAVGALATIGYSSRLLTVGEFGTHPRLAWPLYLLARSMHIVARSVPDVVWALLIVFLVRPGILAGALALALHDSGVLGRLGSDVVDNLDRGPLRNLRAAGAGRVAMVAYGVLPQALPRLVTFLLYRWEVIVRATVVVGFITTAGLGYQLRLDLAFRRWTDVALVLLVYVVLVWGVDALSSALRRLAR